MLQLSSDPENPELLGTLFRAVHTIKGDSTLAHFDPLIPLLMSFEDLLQMIRAGELAFNDLIADVLLSIFDHVKAFVDSCSRIGCADYQPEVFSVAEQQIAKVQKDNIPQHKQYLTKALYSLDPEAENSDRTEFASIEFNELRVDWDQEVEPDLIFFRDIMYPVEKRMDNWEGRSNRQLKLALLLNQYAGNLVNEHQLRVAIYLHDIGMAILPISLLRQKTALLDAELQLVRGHVLRSANFLYEMPHWAQARQFILEHHERADGSGYPEGLSNDEISDGAKIIAIVDAFEAMTHDRSTTTHQKRNIIHAVEEINLKNGSQFCPYWVDVLNKVMSELTRP